MKGCVAAVKETEVTETSFFFTVLCNGYASGQGVTRELELHPGVTNLMIPASGNKYWTNAATYTRLSLSLVQFYTSDLLVGVARLDIDGMLVGPPVPWCAWIGENWPQAPCGLLHWSTQVPFGDEFKGDYRRFSLLTERVVA
jgi:hypothetical protein